MQLLGQHAIAPACLMPVICTRLSPSSCLEPAPAALALLCLPSPCNLFPPALPPLQVGSIVNFSLMYLLAPVAAGPGGAATAGFVQRVFGDFYLKGWGAPTGHMFQVRPFRE